MRQIPKMPSRGIGRPEQYDWDTILNGKSWELRKGQDFAIEPDSFRGCVYSAASRHGVKVTVAVIGDTVCVKASDVMHKPAQRKGKA